MDANPTLDQLQVFLAVAETGSFSAAARQINRAQSVVSYTIANLEAQLEVTLFERGAARQPRLTEAGRALIADARRLVADLQALRARARSINQGLEAEITLALSSLIPSDVVVAELRAFRDRFANVTLNLSIGELGMVMEAVTSGRADIGLGGALLQPDNRLVAERIGHSYMVPVASADHPLARLGRPLTLADVREEVQLVVTDTSGLTSGRDFNVLSYRTWRVGDVHSKRLLTLGGLGWGGLPAPLIADDLRAGRLVILPLEAYEQGQYPLYAISRVASPPGPAGRWLIERFQAQLSSCPDHGEFVGALGGTPPAEKRRAAE
ncbi:LysR family transcriptional regulator [Rhizobiaceae bacterium BDR2-2]|uniref:LysR family transcriptional regulator n=1 Tax=Ectorhizobium quercum TaxID=2965071 RepID=A0AAE3N403_9HYPH|nr:LysR family transcriptional regulator [Ectorhizobium quercum]MCX8998087.1 LysR family transcriptional regulator [Ectorhizobium quercum]